MARRTTQANTETSTKKDEVLDKAMKRWWQSWHYQQGNWHRKWDRDNKLYDGERVYAGYVGTTDTFVPMVFSTIETMVAAFNNSSIRFLFKSSDPTMGSSSSTLKAANGLITEWWEDDQWDLIVEEGSRECFITGMSGNFVSWESDRPHVDQYAMRDIILDPTARKPADLQRPGIYTGRRFFVRKGQLDEYQVVDTDPKSKTYGELIPRYKKAPEGPMGNQGQPDDKELKEMYQGSTLSNAKEDQDEVIEIWDVDRVVAIKNRVYVIEDRINPYKERHQQLLEQKYLGEGMEAEEAVSRAKSEAHGVVPFFFLRNYRRASLFYAKSEIDSIAKEQELLNDFTNMEADYIIRQLAPQKELDPDYGDWIDLINNDPDTVYPFKPGSLVDRPTPILPANSFNNRLNIKNEMRETTAIDQVAKGAQNTADTTATEVRAQLSQTGQRIQSKARTFEKDGFFWWGWILMKMMQLYLNEPLVVEVPGTGGISREEALEQYGIELPKGTAVFDPAEFARVTSVSVQLDVDAASKQEEERQAYLQAYTMLIQDPSNNLEEIKRRVLPKALPKLDQEDIEAIMTPAPQAGLPGMPMGAEAMAGAPAGPTDQLAAAAPPGIPPPAAPAPTEVPLNG